MNDKELTLSLVSWEDLPYLKGKMSESFAVAVKEHFGESDSGDGPPAEELEEAYQRPESKIFMIMKGCSPVGGVVLKINEITRHNKVDLFFIFKEYLNHGLGLEAWRAIERKYPETLVWELITPGCSAP